VFPFFPGEVTRYLALHWMELTDAQRIPFLASVASRLQFVSDPAVAGHWCRVALKTPTFLVDKGMNRTLGFLQFTCALYLQTVPESDAIADVFARYLLRTTPDGEQIVGSFIAGLTPARRDRFIRGISARHWPPYIPFFGDRSELAPAVEKATPKFETSDFVVPGDAADFENAFSVALYLGGRSKLLDLFRQAMAQGWPLPRREAFPDSLFQRLANAGLLEIPFEEAITYARTKCRLKAIHKIDVEPERLIGYLRTMGKVKKETLLSFCSVLSEIRFPPASLFAFGLEQMGKAKSTKAVQVSLRLFAAILNCSTNAITNDIFSEFVKIVNADLSTMPLSEVALCLLGFEPKLGSNEDFLRFVYRAMRQGSLYGPDGTHLRWILRSHGPEFCRTHKYQTIEFDALILDLLASTFPSHVIHGMSLTGTGRIHGAVKLIINRFSEFVSLPQVSAGAVKLLKRRKWGQLFHNLSGLLAVDRTRAEFEHIVSLLPSIARHVKPNDELGPAVAMIICWLLTAPNSVIEFDAVLHILEDRIALIKQKERRAQFIKENVVRCVTGLAKTDGYSTARYVHMMVRFILRVEDPRTCFELICREMLPRLRFFAVFPSLARCYRVCQGPWADDVLALSTQLVSKKCHKASLAAIVRSQVSRGMLLALYDEDCPESDAEVLELK
jgi:hypothetical protein